MPSTEGMHPSLAVIVNRIIQESGGRVTVSSGFRTRAQQQHLWDEYRAGRGNLAARPGTSRHESGLAVDLGGDAALRAQLAAKYGLENTVPGEPWHFELGGENALNVDDDWYAGLGQEFDLGGSMSPEDVLANRLNTIVSMLGMDPTVDVPSIDPEATLPEAEEIEPPDFGLLDPLGGEGVPGAEMSGAGSSLGASFPDRMVGAGSGFGTAHDPRGLGQIAQKLMTRYGWSKADYAALVELWNRESGDPSAGSAKVTWNPGAANPKSSARGIAQKMTSIHGPIEKSASGQIAWGLNYIAGRYGNPRNALAFHNRKNWY